MKRVSVRTLVLLVELLDRRRGLSIPGVGAIGRGCGGVAGRTTPAEPEDPNAAR